jgi:hypothetical protein
MKAGSAGVSVAAARTRSSGSMVDTPSRIDEILLRAVVR